jgi:hypothetical protein
MVGSQRKKRGRGVTGSRGGRTSGKKGRVFPLIHRATASASDFSGQELRFHGEGRGRVVRDEGGGGAQGRHRQRRRHVTGRWFIASSGDGAPMIELGLGWED